MKKFICFLSILMILLGNQMYAETITLGYVDFPPYEYKKDNKPSGILVEIVQLVFQKANVPLKLKFLPFKRALVNTKSGKIDGLFNFYKNPERLKHFDYSLSIIDNPLVFFVRKDSVLDYNNLNDLKGLKIGVMLGYTYGNKFDNHPGFKRDATKSHIANLKKLRMGRIDAYPCDKLVGLAAAIQGNIMSELKILPTPLKVMKGHIGFTKSKHKVVIDKINHFISSMKESGKIDNMIDEYIINMNN